MGLAVKLQNVFDQALLMCFHRSLVRSPYSSFTPLIIPSYIHTFSPERVVEASQIILRDAHVLTK
jgi:hypothetical protein